MRRRLATVARDERGSSIVEGLLALGLVLLVVGVALEALLFMQARTIALAAAQQGAAAAAVGGPEAGLASARLALSAGGGLARGLVPAIEEQAATVTATVEGRAPAPLRLGVVLPLIKAAATLPLERFPSDTLTVSP